MTNEYKFFECIVMHDLMNNVPEFKRLKARCAGDAAEKFCERQEALLDDNDEDMVLVFDEDGKATTQLVTVEVRRTYSSEYLEETTIEADLGPALFERYKQKMAERAKPVT